MNLYSRPFGNRASNGGARLLLESKECEAVSPEFDSSQYARVDGSFETAARTFSVDQDLSASAVGPQENRIIINLFLRMSRLPFHHFQELLRGHLASA